MATTPPTTKEISDNIIAQLEVQLNQTIPLLPKAFNRALAKAIAAVVVILYKYAGFLGLQQFVRFASFGDVTVNGITFSPLLELGRQYGVQDPVGATRADLAVDIDVITGGGTIQAGQLLYSSKNGYTYSVLTSVLLVVPSVSTTIRAVSDQTDTNGRGTAGNLEVGDELTFSNPQPGASSTVTVTSQVVTATDGESEDIYRQRVIDRLQKPPQGGAYSDYELWSEEVAGIINAYPYTGDPGEVDTYVEATVASSGNPDGIPTPAQLIAVQESIQLDLNGLASRRPANAFSNVFPITRRQFEVDVLGLVVVNLVDVQQSIETAVIEQFLEFEPFIAGLSVLPRNDRITNAAVAGLVQSIVSANGGVFDGVIVSTDALPFNQYVLQEGEKAKTTVVFS